AETNRYKKQKWPPLKYHGRLLRWGRCFHWHSKISSRRCRGIGHQTHQTNCQNATHGPPLLQSIRPYPAPKPPGKRLLASFSYKALNLGQRGISATGTALQTRGRLLTALPLA